MNKKFKSSKEIIKKSFVYSFKMKTSKIEVSIFENNNNKKNNNRLQFYGDNFSGSIYLSKNELKKLGYFLINYYTEDLEYPHKDIIVFGVHSQLWCVFGPPDCFFEIFISKRAAPVLGQKILNWVKENC